MDVRAPSLPRSGGEGRGEEALFPVSPLPCPVPALRYGEGESAFCYALLILTQPVEALAIRRAGIDQYNR